MKIMQYTDKITPFQYQKRQTRVKHFGILIRGKQTKSKIYLTIDKQMNFNFVESSLNVADFICKRVEIELKKAIKELIQKMTLSKILNELDTSFSCKKHRIFRNTLDIALLYPIF